MPRKGLIYNAIGIAALASAAWGWSNASHKGDEPKVEQRAAAGEAIPIVDAPSPPGRLDYARIDARIAELAQKREIVGLAVGIIENGQIRFLKGYGETEEGRGEPVTANTVFRWASVSKGVAGDMVAKLAAEKKVDLAAPVSRYSAFLKLPAGNEFKATISDLMTHTLGIYAHAEEGKLEDGQDPRMLRRGLVHLSVTCPPGFCHAYQNVAYDAASDVVASATAKPYQQAVVEQLFNPLGMTSASLTREGLVTAKSWARPHIGGGSPRATEVLEPYYRVPAAGGVNSSVKDLALWMRAQMGLEPQVLSPAMLAEAQAARINTPGEMGRMRKFRDRLNKASYGFGWRIYDYAGHRVVAHRGGVSGYRSLIMFDPAKKTGVVALWNSSTARPGAIEYEVMDMAYGLDQRDWLELAKDSKPPQPAAGA